MPDHLIVDYPELQKDKSKKGSYHKDFFRNKVKKSLMETWDKLDKEEESDEEESNLDMMALTSSDTKSNSDADSDCEEDENKAIEEPSDVEVLKEQALQVEAIEAILKNVERIESATETQAPKAVVEVEKVAEDATEVAEAENSGTFLDPIFDSTLDSSCPQSITKTSTLH
ncbi:hypothetical protein KIW84_058104 [Lathyrus oleraceus]|uniref:Uncharacterized protein n=1 Tax=Pisum sativum TaxID=3888 RepID=A0A9D5ANW2_PEA|nr:hypothetical protein KIW84_058104 [Pisum sativum]